MRIHTVNSPSFLRPCLGSTAIMAALTLTACEGDFLDFTDPDIITDANSASGAIALRNGVIQRFTQMANGQQGPDALFGPAQVDEGKVAALAVVPEDAQHLDDRLPADSNGQFAEGDAGPEASLAQLGLHILAVFLQRRGVDVHSRAPRAIS